LNQPDFEFGYFHIMQLNVKNELKITIF